VLRPGGLALVLEPDFGELHVESSVVPDGALPGDVDVRHPRIGSELAGLLRARGCLLDDLVTERSFGHALGALPVNAHLSTAQAVAAGRLDPDLRDAWLREQEQRSRSGAFVASWVKVLVVARTPAGGPPSLLGRHR